MGQVFAAYDPKLDRRVALKLIHTRGNATEQARLQREAKALARVSHPNVLTIYEVDVLEGRVVLALEFVSGRTLKQLIAGQSGDGLDTERALELLVQAGRGLVALHKRGLIHRDFKPSNVLVGTDGRVRVADFGLARPFLPETTLGDGTAPRSEGTSLQEDVTRSGRTVGTPAYMAPEQFGQASLDARTDQFGFCLTAWELLTGRRAFVADDFDALSAAVRSGKIEPPPDGRLPRAVEAALRRGLKTRPAARWRSLEDLLAELDKELRRLRGGRPKGGRARRLALLGTAVGIAALAFGALRLDEHRKTASCEAGATTAAGGWNDHVAGEVADALANTSIGKVVDHREKLLPLLDAQADALVRADIEVCMRENVDKTWDSEKARRAGWCLEERRLELSTLVNGLRNPSEIRAQAAIPAANELEVVAGCLEESTVLGEEPVPSQSELAAVRNVAEAVAGAELLHDTGAYADARAAALEATSQAESLGWGPLVARSELAEARALRAVGDSTGALAAASGAFAHSVRSSDWSLASATADKLFWLAAERDDVPGQRAWLDVASATADKARIPGAFRRARDERRRAQVALHDQGAAASAELLQSAIEKIESSFGPTSLVAADYRLDLADLLTVLGDADGAAAEIEKALRVAEVTYGSHHPSLTRFRIAEAAGLGLREDFGQAAARVDDWLDMLEQEGTATDSHRVTLLRFSGNWWRLHGEHQKAQARLERSLALSDRTSESADYRIMLALGSVFREMGDLDRAKAILSRGLQTAYVTVGDSNLQYAAALSEMSLVLVERREFEQALALALRALSLRENKLSVPDRDLALSLSTVGQIYQRQGQIDEAIPLLERAAAVSAKALGEEHPDTALAYSNLSVAKTRSGQFDDAIRLAEKALSIRLDVLGRDNPWTAQSYSTVGGAYRKAGRYEDAISAYEQCIELRDELLPPAHPSRSLCYVGLGASYRGAGSLKDALAAFVRAWSFSYHTLGEGDPSVVHATNAIGGLCDKHRYRPACRTLRKTPPRWDPAPPLKSAQ